MSEKLKVLHKHIKASKNGKIGFSNTLIELAIKIHNCPIEATCTDYPGEVSTYSVDELMNPLFTSNPMVDQYGDGTQTYRVSIFEWKGVKVAKDSIEDSEEVKEIEVKEPIVVEPKKVESSVKSKIKTYTIQKPVVVTTFESIQVTLYSYIAHIIHQTRLARGLTQLQLANLSGLSQTTISYLENEAEEVNVTINSLSTICEVLGLHITDVFPPKEDTLLKEAK
jgi:DNA-binding XRE family transcriptional regulator